MARKKSPRKSRKESGEETPAKFQQSYKDLPDFIKTNVEAADKRSREKFMSNFNK